VPGIFIAGVVVAGYDANKVFIENGRYHGDQIVAGCLGPAPPPRRSAGSRFLSGGIGDWGCYIYVLPHRPTNLAPFGPVMASVSTYPDVMDKLVSLAKRRGFIFQSPRSMEAPDRSGITGRSASSSRRM
jgi:hypothetical protein